MGRNILFVLLVSLLAMSPLGGDIDMKNWGPVSAEDLALKDNPDEPGAKAMVLFRHGEFEFGYYREHGAIKIFTDAAMDLANLELPADFEHIRARTIKPDGTWIEIEKDDILKKLVTKKRSRKTETKVFAFPGVTAGAILEYKYSQYRQGIKRLIFAWPIQTSIYCREAWLDIDASMAKNFNRFVLDTYRQAAIDMRDNGKWIRYIASRVPGQPESEFMPPEDEVTAIFLMYLAVQKVKGSRGLDLNKEADRNRYIDMFWEQYGEETAEHLEKFMKSKQKVRELRERILAGDQRPVSDLQKIYDYVNLNFRNTSFETRSAEQRNAEKAEKLKDNKKVDQVIDRGYGTSEEIMLLCTALLRSANIDAHPAYVCGRDDAIYRRWILLDQFDDPLVAIKSAKGYSFLDPATPYCPYGYMSWWKQGVAGMVFHDRSGEFIQTGTVRPELNTISRRGRITIDDRSIRGELTLTFSGTAGLDLKNDWDDETDEARRDFVARYLREDFTNIKLESCEYKNLRDPRQDLAITVTFSLPDYVVQTRTRRIFKPSLLGRNQNRDFVKITRDLPVFFHHPVVFTDEIEFTMPADCRCERLPDPVSFDNPVGTFNLGFTRDPDRITCRRTFLRRGIVYKPEQYTLIRQLYEAVRKGDDTSVILQVQE